MRWNEEEEGGGKSWVLSRCQSTWQSSFALRQIVSLEGGRAAGDCDPWWLSLGKRAGRRGVGVMSKAGMGSAFQWRLGEDNGERGHTG